LRSVGLWSLGAVATFEREIMLERQREGIAKAKAASRPRRAVGDPGRPPGRGVAAGRPAIGARRLGGGSQDGAKQRVEAERPRSACCAGHESTTRTTPGATSGAVRRAPGRS
jgi:hypothetical protein